MQRARGGGWLRVQEWFCLTSSVHCDPVLITFNKNEQGRLLFLPYKFVKAVDFIGMRGKKNPPTGGRLFPRTAKVTGCTLRNNARYIK